MLVVKEDVIDRTWPLLAPFDPPRLHIDKFDHWERMGRTARRPAGCADTRHVRRQPGYSRLGTVCVAFGCFQPVGATMGRP
jgi:hypothetical protein